MTEEMKDNAKPVMSRTEASWHETQAGMRAAEAARQAGEDPALVGGVVGSTLPRPEVAGYQIKPASKGTVMAIQRMAPALLEWAEKNGMKPSPNPQLPSYLDLIEMALTIIVFADPRRVYRETEAGLPQSLLDEADRLIFEVPVPEMVDLQGALETEMAAIGLVGSQGEVEEGQPGKPAAGSGESSERKTPPPVGPSPSSTGSWPNTDSRWTPPSGNSPSSPPMPSCPPAMSETEGRPPAPTSPSKPPSRPATSAAGSSLPNTTSSQGNTHGGYPES